MKNPFEMNINEKKNSIKVYIKNSNQQYDRSGNLFFFFFFFAPIISLIIFHNSIIRTIFYITI